MPAPFVLSSDLVSAYPAKSVTLADYIDTSLAAKTDLAMTQNAQTGSSYSYALADASKLLTMSNASANTVLVTKQATVTWVTGTQLRVMNLGAGVTTLVADTGVTINNNVTLGQYQGGTLIRTASDVWLLVPNTARGKIVSTTKTDVFTTTAAGWTDVTGLSVAITPASTTSKILVLAVVNGASTVGGNQAYVKILRGATDIAVGDAAGSRIQVGAALPVPSNGNMTISGIINHLDSPASAASVTYKIQIFNTVSGQKNSVNASTTDANDTFTGRSISSITAIEVLA